MDKNDHPGVSYSREEPGKGSHEGTLNAVSSDAVQTDAGCVEGALAMVLRGQLAARLGVGYHSGRKGKLRGGWLTETHQPGWPSQLNLFLFREGSAFCNCP